MASNILLVVVTPMQLSIAVVVLLVAAFIVMTLVMVNQRTRYRTDLREKEAQFRSIITQSSDGVAIVDNDGRFINTSEKLCEMTGYSRKELSRLSFPEILFGDTTANLESYRIFHQGMKKLRFHREPSEEIRRRDGSTVKAEARYFYLQDGTVLSLLHDTTRVKSDGFLQPTDDILRQIFDLSLDMIVVVDKQRKIREFNRAAERAFGYRRDEVVGMHVDMLYAEPDHGKRAHGASFAETDYQQIMNKRKNGEVFPCVLASRVMFNARGEIIGIVGFSREVMQATSLEEQMRIAEQRFWTIFSNSSDGIFRSTPTGTLIEINPAFVEMLGYGSPQEVLGQDQLRELYVNPEDRKKLFVPENMKGDTWSFDLELRRKNDLPVNVNIVARAVRDETGKISMIEGIVRRRDRKEAAGLTLQGETAEPAVQLPSSNGEDTTPHV